ncbi:DUF3800 domain-containing protein [Hydrogenophaga crocea]|uniref:DUF3800 domain-containing protein n=1 Tax=Hydrogenophaga crocea TaxID=2716225 RepID=A0A6G8ICJ3_9BURK|nr:DUF3800 domain-containing protein [Hydrogenophaga crocea]QIM50775.1 DUF3800 domain-containing protein [Hydrogenophaga crocea]
MDDSTSHVGERRLFLAGYMLPEDRWPAFNWDWLAALKAGKPLSTLHMTQSFKGWSHDERLIKLRQLVEVIANHRPVSVEVSVSTRDFKEILEDHSPYDLRHPYFSCFIAFAVTSARTVNELGLQGPINFIFDEQGKLGTDAAIWYEPMRQMQAPEVQALMGPKPVFRSDDNEPGLQAADMLAWFRRLLSEPTCTDEQRLYADAIIFNHGVAEIPKEMLESWAAHFATVPGIEDVKGKRGSVNKTIDRVLSAFPPERALSVMEQVDHISKRSRWIKNFLTRVGLERVWKWYAKRPIRLR